MKFLCIGDSLTFGYGLHKGQCWIDLLNSNTANEFINRGCNGDTTAGMLSRFSIELNNDCYDGIFIMGGSNDLLCGRTLDYIKDNLILMVNESLDKNIPIFLLIPPLSFPDLAKKLWYLSVNYYKFNENINLLNIELTKEFSDNKNITIIDLSSIIPFRENLYIDGIHLNPMANKIICDNIIKVLN